MKYSTYMMFVALVMLMAFAISADSSKPTLEEEEIEDGDQSVGILSAENELSMIGGRQSRFLAQKRRVLAMTCNKYPRVCRTPGSPGPDCCKKKCVNVMTDKHNCGECGKKCKHPEICCNGKCINPLSNKRHCGGCHKRCKKGNVCVYGMCNYA